MSEENKAVVRSIYRLTDGKIAEVWSNFDQLGLLQQLGLISAPSQAG